MPVLVDVLRLPPPPQAPAQDEPDDPPEQAGLAMRAVFRAISQRNTIACCVQVDETDRSAPGTKLAKKDSAADRLVAET